MSLIMSEYMCPEHGVFEALVERPAPDEMPCPTSLCSPDCSPDDAVPCNRDCGYSCGASSPWCMSSPKPKNLSVPCYAVTRGGDTERRPGMLDTRKLGDGSQTMTQWKADRAKETQERRHQQLVKVGLKTKRIQVG